MRRIFILILTIVLCLSFSDYSKAQKKKEDQPKEFTQKILAVVNGEPITQTDVDEILAPIYLQYKSTYQGKELEEKLKVARADILDQLIGDKLILQEAKRQELVVDEKEIDALVEQLKSNFKKPEEFDEMLKNQKVSLMDLRKRYKEQLLIKKAVSKEVISKITVSPTSIAEYYDAHKKDFTIPEQVHLRSIFLSTEKNGDEIEKKANQIYEELQKGTEFLELVEKYSDAPNVVDSGDMGFVKRGSLRAEIEDVVFNLKAGEFSKPLKTDTGIYLFKVIEKKKATIPPLENVQEQIRKKLYNQQVTAKIKQWIDKLKESALIEVKSNEKEKS